MFITRDGGFTFEIGPEDLSRGLRPRKTLPRNEKFLVECFGAVGYERALQTIEDLSDLIVDTSLIEDGYPFPQIFCFTNHTIVCGHFDIYELVGGSLELKFSGPGGIRWTAVDFNDFIYLTNDNVSVVRNPDGTYELSDLPIGTSLCNFNGQVLIGAPNIEWYRIPHGDGESDKENLSGGSEGFISSPIVGPIYVAGNGDYGRLGNGSQQNVQIWSPMEAQGVHNWKMIGGGDVYAVFIREDGTLWGAGWNNYGQLGTGDAENKYTLTQIGTDSDWVWVSKNNLYYTFAIKKDGTLWGTGENHGGELVLGDNIQRNSFTQIGTDKWKQVGTIGDTVGIKEDGRLYKSSKGYYQGYHINLPPFVPIDQQGDSWKKLSDGDGHILVIKDDGTLWGYGDNNDYELGLSTRGFYTLTKLQDGEWTDIAAGSGLSLAIKSDGSLWGTGRNSYGQLGLGDTTDRSEWTLISSEKWKKVSTSYEATLALKDDGTLWGCGLTTYDELGVPGLPDKQLTLTKLSDKKFLEIAEMVRSSYAIKRRW